MTEIEKLAEVIKKVNCDNNCDNDKNEETNGCCNLFDCCIQNIATALYKQGYRKQSDTIKEFAEKLKDMVKPLRDLEIAAIRESREYNFIDEKARRNWLSTRKETAQAYDTTMRFIDNILKQYEVEDK